MSWFWDRFFNHFGPPNWHPKPTPNHRKSMLWPVWGQDGSNERFLSIWDLILIDFSLILMWLLFDIRTMLRSSFARFSIDYEMHFTTEFDILAKYCLSVCTEVIPVSSGSMKTTAARGTARGQPPFHASLSYCGSQLNVIPSSVSRRKRSSACDVCLLHLINRTRSLVLDDHPCIMLFDGFAGTSLAHLGPTRPCMPGND